MVQTGQTSSSDSRTYYLAAYTARASPLRSFSRLLGEGQASGTHQKAWAVALRPLSAAVREQCLGHCTAARTSCSNPRATSTLRSRVLWSGWCGKASITAAVGHAAALASTLVLCWMVPTDGFSTSSVDFLGQVEWLFDSWGSAGELTGRLPTTTRQAVVVLDRTFGCRYRRLHCLRT
mmetsp:Transcript_66300/g.158614  ORF Transcript_66300/g.158614 Transcript_66300/m.158614 type:complete len:178 (+) Transcript_66300:242-775(+)